MLYDVEFNELCTIEKKRGYLTIRKHNKHVQFYKEQLVVQKVIIHMNIMNINHNILS